MKFSKKTKIILLSAAFVFLSFAGWIGFNAYNYHFKIIWKHKEERAQRFNSIEKSFNRSPNISDAMQLVDWYYNDKKDIPKALYFGNECIRLGVNETPAGYLANFWLADIYQNTGNKTLARKHLRVAIRLDKEKIILENNWIDNGVLKGVFSAEEIKSLAQD